MGDDTYFTIQIKGEAYRFAPISDDNIVAIQLVSSMGAGMTKLLKATMNCLRDASTPEQWDAITDRVVSKEVGVAEMTNAVKRLVDKTVKAKKEEADGDDHRAG